MTKFFIKVTGWCSLISLGLVLLASQVALADVSLPRLLSDGAVLQRGKPITVWGWADDAEEITVKFVGKELTTRAKAGRWQMQFPEQQAGGPYELHIQGNNHIRLHDIWIGDLWIAAGQSNMELPLKRVRYRYPQLIEQTNLPQVRQFSVPVAYDFSGPREDFHQGEWKTATPPNLADFSAVGFFFARQLTEKYQIPIGILSISVGGSPVEAWMSEGALKKYPNYTNVAHKFKDDKYLETTIAQDKSASDAWYAQSNKQDKGLTSAQPWSAAEIDTATWKPVKVPGFLREQNIDFINGVVWFRKNIELTGEQARQKAQLWLGAIVDGDQVYINGVLVGQTGYQYPPRIYDIPANVLKAGKNTLSLRVTSYSGNPGFVKDKTYALKLGEENINLEGEWRYQIGMRADAFPQTTTIHYQPTSLFNAKLAPALRFPIKGVIWYQGESNVTRAQEYQQLFPELIADWRKQFNQGNFPFVYAQLANFLPPQSMPTESQWAELREAQRKTLSTPATAMAVAIDIGEWNDIHPLNKQAVGERLALAAQKIAYGEKSLIASGPMLRSIKRKNKQLIVTFDSVAKGLVIRGEKLQRIAIAGKDKQFMWANAKINGKKLVVWHDDVPDPVWVRYAWADNPEGANLYNTAGLPASPFQASVNDK